MKIKDGFVVNNVGGRIIAVATGTASKDFHGMITLNETAKFLWDKLMIGSSEEEIMKAVVHEFSVSEEKAGADVHCFINKLRNAGILNE